ncbi:MAG: tail fiber protein [Succinivibrio sp.]|nr:tail fiber protein [Succinivibrio sp.]
MAQNVVVTNAGLQALINAEQTGTGSVVLNKVIFSTTAINASTASVLSDITDIVATLSSVSGTATSDHTIHVSAGDTGDQAYTVKTIGIVTDQDILFAVVSSESGLISKIATTQAYVSFDMELTQGNPQYITFGDTNFLNPDATFSTKGIAQLATEAEALLGANESKIITPATLAQVLAVYDQRIQDQFKECGFNTGDIKPLISNNINDGWLLGNSAVVSRSAISKLTQYAYDNGFVRSAAEQAEYEANPATFSGPIYGPGDGSTTIQLPDFRGRSLMGAMSSARVGRYQPEQLPNIQGSITPMQSGAYKTNPNPAGAFSWVYTGNVGFGESGTYHRGTIGFNAHNSDTKYTDDGHVYPLSLALNFIIKT